MAVAVDCLWGVFVVRSLGSAHCSTGLPAENHWQGCLLGLQGAENGRSALVVHPIHSQQRLCLVFQFERRHLCTQRRQALAAATSRCGVFSLFLTQDDRFVQPRPFETHRGPDLLRMSRLDVGATATPLTSDSTQGLLQLHLVACRGFTGQCTTNRRRLLSRLSRSEILEDAWAANRIGFNLFSWLHGSDRGRMLVATGPDRRGNVGCLGRLHGVDHLGLAPHCPRCIVALLVGSILVQ
mmetsp:Transcript_7854/g.21884  ORF Transcript_7854/g.21884 Transcript_7854/m.21884 type:complete len:239 (+) Transcript_7854:5213-5929(+)